MEEMSRDEQWIQEKAKREDKHFSITEDKQWMIDNDLASFSWDHVISMVRTMNPDPNDLASHLGVGKGKKILTMSEAWISLVKGPLHPSDVILALEACVKKS